MKYYLALLLSLFMLTVAKAQFKIVAYLPKYTSTLADHVDAFDFTKVTHINIAFFNPDTLGNFSSSQGTGLDQIVTKAHLNNVKVLISIGGGGLRPNYSNLLKPENRSAFITKIVALVSLYNVDGIDVDLEGENIDENYEDFVTELSAALNKPMGKLLTAAVAWWTRERITDACLQAFDFINVMAYDKNGSEHSPYSYASQHLDYWKGVRGLSSSKIVIGVPFYGYYTEGGISKSITYKNLVTSYPGAEWKDFQKRSTGEIVNYNGIPTIQNKTAFAQAEAGGIMFWQVLQDQAGTSSLLGAIYNKINNSSGWTKPFITWQYNLETDTVRLDSLFGGDTINQESISILDTLVGFLPQPTYGAVRVFSPGGSGATFNLIESSGTSKLELIASATGPASKFSWYNIKEATPTASLRFNLELDASVTNGQIIIPFGYSTKTSSTFNNTNQLTGSNTYGVFGAIRLDFYGGSFATLSYRNSSYGYQSINSNVFNKTGTYEIEIYCNNEYVERSYVKGSVTYHLPAQTFNVWVNGTMMSTSGGVVNFPATGELENEVAINSFSINTSGNSGTPTSSPPTLENSLKATISNINLDFVFKTYGTWVGANDAPNASYYWSYNPVGTISTFNTGASNQEAVATSTAANYLPATTSGNARVFTPSGNIGGGFNIGPTTLTQTATTGNSPVKFSAYGINGATTVTSWFFDIDFNNTTATNGVLILAIGKYTNGNLFNNTNQLSSSSSAGVFGALKLEFYGSNIQTYYRNSALAYPSASNNNLLFSRSGGAKRVEIYANNSNAQQSYVRSSVTHNLPQQTFNVWINGMLYTPANIGTANIPATGELATGEVIDAVVLNASNSSSNLLNFSVSNIKIGRIPLQVLPISLASFSAKKANSSVQLSFTTTSEHNNDYFEILKSIDGIQFSSLSKINGSGNSNKAKTYLSVDYRPAIGANYYKLRQVDIDGKSVEFGPVSVNFSLSVNNKLSAFVDKDAKLLLSYTALVNSNASVSVTDLNGKKLATGKFNLSKGSNQLAIDISHIPNGLYVVSLIDNDKVNAAKFIK